MSRLTPETVAGWKKHWDKVLEREGLGMSRGEKIPRRPNNPPPPHLERATQDPPPITAGPGQRVYICVLCRRQVALGRESFATGQPHPKCQTCHGTIRRLKAPF